MLCPASVQEELAAELCLLAPARLEHLIPPMPRMMHAVLRALHGSDQSVSVALKVMMGMCILCWHSARASD